MQKYPVTNRDIAGYSGLHRLNIRGALSTLSEGATVIDLGCGEGNFVKEIAKEFPQLIVKGLDLHPPRCKNFVKADLTRRFPLENESADLAVCTVVANWLPSECIETFYVEAERVLKKDGVGYFFPFTSGTISREKREQMMQDLEFDRKWMLREYSPWKRKFSQLVFGEDSKFKRFYLS